MLGMFVVIGPFRDVHWDVMGVVKRTGWSSIITYFYLLFECFGGFVLVTGVLVRLLAVGDIFWFYTCFFFLGKWVLFSFFFVPILSPYHYE